MKDEPEPTPIEAALKRLPVEPPRAAFRNLVRDELLARGEQPSATDAAAPRPHPPVVERAPHPVPAAGPLSSGALSWQVTAGLVAIAAAVLLLLWVPSERDGAPRPRLAWSVLRADGPVEIDGHRTEASDLGALGLSLQSARTVSTFTQPVVFKLRDEVRLGMEARSLVRLPVQDSSALHAPAEGEEVRFELEAGTLHIMTRPGQEDATVVVETPHSVVRITASVLSIEVFEGKGTCICVLDGEAFVEVLDGDAPPVRVEPDSTCFVFADAGVPVNRGPSETMVGAQHLSPLLAFQADALTRF